MPEDILGELDLAPTEIPSLPARTRDLLIDYLIRWEHHDAARRCLQQLLATHSHLVSVYDRLARIYLALDQPDRALEMMRRRHALRPSNSSQALEARAHLAAGDLEAARTIAEQMMAEHPQLLLAWDLQAELRLAAGDMDGAEAAWRQRESLSPGAAVTCLGLAHVWRARGDLDKSLLWARTALSRAKSNERQPSVNLLRLLETLYRDTGQPAQTKATAAQLRQRQQQELADLRQALGLGSPAAPPPRQPDIERGDPRAAIAPELVAGAVELTSSERRRLDDTLRRHFGHEGFRPGQADAIAATLRGESVLAVMPTGAGKSLCYQLAALLLPGTTLVISPLIALMKDQLDGLPAEMAVTATTLNSTLDGEELGSRLARAANGGYKLLYAAPERLRQRPFIHALKRAGLSLLVVDEAHCVSLWGHDFRPDYLFIAKAWQELDRPRILAMTATATPRVRDDIQTALGKMRLIASDVHRPNLHLEARQFANNQQKNRALLNLCGEIKGSGIVYARTRRQCEELAEMLRARDISAIHYHAGVEDRHARQDLFMNDQARIVVATIAFGMGVDKADVRFIVHYGPPQALENYYQEAGRAGRDGLPARCILFHSPGDRSNLTRWTRQNALQLEFLRGVYGAIQRRLGPASMGLLAAADLERDLQANETQIRVAVHFLETAGLLWRGFDLPRTVTLARCRRGSSRLEAEAHPAGKEPTDSAAAQDSEPLTFAAFSEAARLPAHGAVSRDTLSLCGETGLDPRTIEAQLMVWSEAGWLRYRGIGRDMLLALPDPPADAQQRVTAMLADYHSGQDGRSADIMAYARTKTCRHGYISTYFGGRPIERCQVCDNCLGTTAGPSRPAQAKAQPTRRPSRPETVKPSASGDPACVLLQGVRQLPFPLGRTGLARAMQGAGTSPIQADRFPLFGALADWTQKSIRQMIDQLEEEGLLVHFEKGGYRLLRLSDKGQALLDSPSRLDISITLPQKPTDSTTIGDYDEILFEQLRAWRMQAAQEVGKPPFVVFHDKTLKQIAAEKPTNPGELIAIRGVGPRKLEQYGQAVLSIVADHQVSPEKLSAE